LRAVRLDGWKQAWLLPAGSSGVVTLTYLPDAYYRDAIIGGLGSLALIMLIAVWPGTLVPWPRRGRGGGEGAGRGAAGRDRGGAGRGAAPAVAAADVRSRRTGLGPGFSSAVTSATVACALLLTGFWLGGYPGAVILIVATGLFMAAVSYRRSRRYWLELSRPRVLAGLLLAAAASGAVGEHLLLTGNSGLPVAGLSGAVPQIICLVIVGRLAAALILPEP
jgi:arabinofuranan 3-O-arabinosyltransferase